MLSQTTKIALKNALIGCAIADAVGAGTEMKSRQWLLKPENFRGLLTKYWGRDPKFSAGFVPGNYTDDFEMTLAVLFALFNTENGQLTTDALYNGFRFLHAETVKKLGVERAGYGSISKLLKTWNEKGPDAFKADLIESMLTVKVNVQGDDAPGNATLMRVSPIIFFPDFVSNAVENALSTKPHAYTIFTSVYLVLAGVLLQKGTNPVNLISETTQEFKKYTTSIIERAQRKREEVLSGLPEEKRATVEFLDISKLQSRFDELLLKLDEIDHMPQPMNPDVIYTLDRLEKFDFSSLKIGGEGPDPVDGIDYHNLMFPYATPLKGECGLGAKASQTLFCAMFCLKWNRTTTLRGNLMRIQMFGGDTDTLGACVFPYIYQWHSNNGSNNLPQWIFAGLEMYGSEIKYGYDDSVFNHLAHLPVD